MIELTHKIERLGLLTQRRGTATERLVPMRQHSTAFPHPHINIPTDTQAAATHLCCTITERGDR